MTFRSFVLGTLTYGAADHSICGMIGKLKGYEQQLPLMKGNDDIGVQGEVRVRFRALVTADNSALSKW